MEQADDLAYTPFDLVPESEHTALFCMSIAQGNTAEFSRLFNTLPASEVWELYLLRRACEWEPKGKVKKEKGS